MNKAEDWLSVNTTIPISCCKSKPANQSECTVEFAFKEGCKGKLFNFLDKQSVILAAVGIGIALIQVGIVKLSIYLCS